MGGLLHTADLGHGPLLLVLLLGGGGHNVHIMLLLCQMDTDKTSTLQSLVALCCKNAVILLSLLIYHLYIFHNLKLHLELKGTVNIVKNV